MKVFDTHGSAQQLRVQKVWEALLTAVPLDHKRMQTVLLALEIDWMMRWDGDSKGDVNRHFDSITELYHTMGCISNLSIEDVLKSVLMTTLKASTNLSLRDAYHKVLDDLDDDQDLSFALTKTLAPASFGATLTRAALTNGAAPALCGTTKAPKAWVARRVTKHSRDPSPMEFLPFFANSSTTMVSSL